MASISLKVMPQGLYCPSGDFFIDPWRPVKTALITHAHGDHARWGHEHYIAVGDSEEILRHRLGANISLESIAWKTPRKLGDTWVSFYPAGHIYGSAQIKIETKKEIIVVSGDYKRCPDATCAPFEPVECDVFITETTFAQPIYQWENPQTTAKKIYEWWQKNSAEGHPSILFAYALGKAQRVLNLLKDYTDRPIWLHGAVYPLAKIYQEKGIALAPFQPIGENKGDFSRELIIAPPSAAGSPWLKRFASFRTAAASGWMTVRGMRKRNGHDHGFILSDHADWEDLIQTVKQTKATQVLTTHGYSDLFARYLTEELGIKARELKGLHSSGEED